MAADDSGSLIETAAALMIMSMAAVMVLTFNVTSSRVRRQAEMRAAAIALIERHSAAARQIDCVQNAGVLTLVCGPEPAADTDSSADPPTEGNKVIKPAGADESAGESGHDRIRLEWADYYQLADMANCTSMKAPPRAVREITARWRDGTGGTATWVEPDGAGGHEVTGHVETRLVLGPHVPLSRGWTAIGSSATVPSALSAGRQTFRYAPTRETVQVATYGGSAAGAVHCRVIVAPPGKTEALDENGNLLSPSGECKLDTGWNDPGTSVNRKEAGGCLW